MSGHTPGPWAVSNSDNYREAKEGQLSVVSLLPNGEREFHIVRVWDDGPHPVQDARLIAAAPELLEALQAMVSELHLTPDSEADKVLKDARAAIAKATGEQA